MVTKILCGLIMMALVDAAGCQSDYPATGAPQHSSRQGRVSGLPWRATTRHG